MTPLTDQPSESQPSELEKNFDKADAEFCQKINLNTLEPNSVLVFRIANENMGVIMSLPLLAKKYEEILKTKNIAILIVSPGESVETLDERSMARIGWYKKEPTLIVTPDKF